MLFYALIEGWEKFVICSISSCENDLFRSSYYYVNLVGPVFRNYSLVELIRKSVQTHVIDIVVKCTDYILH